MPCIETSVKIALETLQSGGSVDNAFNTAYEALGDTDISREAFISSLSGRFKSVLEIMSDGTPYMDAIKQTASPLDGKSQVEILYDAGFAKPEEGSLMSEEELAGVTFAGGVESFLAEGGGTQIAEGHTVEEGARAFSEEEGIRKFSLKEGEMIKAVNEGEVAAPVLPDEQAPAKIKWGRNTAAKVWNAVWQFFSYGTADVASSNTAYMGIGKQMNNQVDNIKEYNAKLSEMLYESGPAPYVGASKAEKARAEEEFEDWQRKAFSTGKNDPLPSTEGYSEVGRGVIDGWKKVVEYTGGHMVRAEIMVRMPDGKWRKFKPLGERFWPRAWKAEYRKALREIHDTKELTPVLAEFGGILKRAGEIDKISRNSIELWWDNQAETRGAGEGVGSAAHALAGDEQTGFYASVDKAQASQKPLAEAMDFSLHGGAGMYTMNWSNRMAQVDAYGQATGEVKEGDKVVQHAKKDAFAFIIEKLRSAPNGSTRFKEEIKNLEEWKKDAYMLRGGDMVTGLVNLTGKVATLTMLTGGFNAVRNMTGWGPSAAVFGTINSFKATWEMRNYAEAARQARSWGVIHQNMELLLAGNDVTGGAGGVSPDMLDRATKTGLKWALFTAAENFVRIQSAFTASSFISEGVGAIKNGKNPALAEEFKDMAERLEVDWEAIVNEDSSTGEVTSSFIRRAVDEVQGGYRFNQLPAWMQTNTGRFFNKFGSYGLQVTRSVRRNALEPIAKKPENIRSWLPLFRYLGTAAWSGELLQLVRQYVFGKERGDKTLSEIAKGGTPMTDLFWRMVNNAMYAGTLGQMSDFAGQAKRVGEHRRLKRPFEPAGGAIVANAAKFLMNASREKKLSIGNFEEFMEDQVAAYRYGMPLVKRAIGMSAPEWDVAQRQESEEDARFLHTATRRFQQAVGDDVKNMIGAPTFLRGEFKQDYDNVRGELMVGNVLDAQRFALEYAGNLDPDKRAHAWANLSGSIRGRQPMKIGSKYNDDIKMRFITWARRNLKPEDVERIMKVQHSYMQTAKAAGLISGGDEGALTAMKGAMTGVPQTGRGGGTRRRSTKDTRSSYQSGRERRRKSLKR